MRLFTSKTKTDKELQDELKALCDKIVAKQYTSFDDEQRYEQLLYKIYQRNLEPCVKLTPKK